MDVRSVMCDGVDCGKRFVFEGGLVYAVPLGAWRQGREQVRVGGRAVHDLVAVNVPVLEGDGYALVPVISGNSVVGALKNALSERMFTYYMEERRDWLRLVYEPSPLGVLAASLFRMKAPFVSIQTPSRKLYSMVWGNFIWTTWGVGLASWAPHRKVRATDLVPLLEPFRDFAEAISRLASMAGVDVEVRPAPAPSVDAVEAVEGVARRYAFVTRRYRLRKRFDDDFLRLEVEIDFARMAEELGKAGLFTGEDVKSLQRPVPFEVIVAPPGVPLASILHPGVVSDLFSPAEVMTVAEAMKHVFVIGPRDNLFKLTVVAVFRDVETNERLVVGYRKEPGLTEPIGRAEELAGAFEEWMGRVNYPSVVRAVAEAVIAEAKGGG